MRNNIRGEGMKTALVLGAGGFIGGHLANKLKKSWILGKRCGFKT